MDHGRIGRIPGNPTLQKVVNMKHTMEAVQKQSKGLGTLSCPTYMWDGTPKHLRSETQDKNTIS